jgi:hypothetical protein
VTGVQTCALPICHSVLSNKVKVALLENPEATPVFLDLEEVKMAEDKKE